jgi:hypothetical protein
MLGREHLEELLLGITTDRYNRYQRYRHLTLSDAWARTLVTIHPMC